MYLTKESNRVIISDYDELITRVVRHIVLITQGSQISDCIHFDFEEKKIKSLFDYLDNNEIKYSLDAELTKYIEDVIKSKDLFSTHTNFALEIKNNLNESSKLYVDFLRKMKSLMPRGMYSHQAKAAFHMAYSLNSCNFSVPGTGKTTIVYATYAYLFDQQKIDKLLIIGPMSSFLAWKNEYYECFKSNPEITDLSALNREEKIAYLKSYKDIQSKITFINYEGFTGISSAFIEFLDKNKTMVVLDEAHKIKNPNAQRAKNIMSFAKNAVSRVILTGTPIPNGYKDLYNLFEFIWPKKNIIGFNPNQLQLMSTDSSYKYQVKLLMDNIDPFYIRITKKSLNLPDPIFNEPIMVKMGKIQQKIYDLIAEDFLNNEVDASDDDLRTSLKKAKLIRLMQVATNPAAISSSLRYSEFELSEYLHLINNYEKLETPTKYSEVFRLVSEIKNKGEKVIIWTQYTYNLRSLKKFLMSKGIKVETLFGEIDNADRERIIQEFHMDESLTVIIANPAAVAESISLHKVCHNAIYLDKNFNAAQYMQSKDRIHRVGLKPTDIINYYFLLAENSIESVIHNRVLEKEKNMLDVIEGKEVPLFSNTFDADFSDEDIQAIQDYFNALRK